MIMLCILPLIPLSTRFFSKVDIFTCYLLHFYSISILQLTANETLIQLNAYAKAGQIIQEVFSSLRTVLSLNGGKFEQKR